MFAFVVDEFVVEAFDVAKFEVVPQSVVMNEEMIFANVATNPAVVVVADKEHLK